MTIDPGQLSFPLVSGTPPPDRQHLFCDIDRRLLDFFFFFFDGERGGDSKRFRFACIKTRRQVINRRRGSRMEDFSCRFFASRRTVPCALMIVDFFVRSVCSSHRLGDVLFRRIETGFGFGWSGIALRWARMRRTSNWQLTVYTSWFDLSVSSGSGLLPQEAFKVLSRLLFVEVVGVVLLKCQEMSPGLVNYVGKDSFSVEERTVKKSKMFIGQFFH